MPWEDAPFKSCVGGGAVYEKRTTKDFPQWFLNRNIQSVNLHFFEQIKSTHIPDDFYSGGDIAFQKEKGEQKYFYSCPPLVMLSASDLAL